MHFNECMKRDLDPSNSRLFQTSVSYSSRLMEDQRKADGFGQPSLAPIAGDEVTAVRVLGRGDVQNIHRARTQLRGISFRQ